MCSFEEFLFLDKPEIRSIPLSSHEVLEGQTATLRCALTDANPNTNIKWRWIKTDNPHTVIHIEPNYTIHDIPRVRSGSYNCTASNTVGTSKAVTIDVDVQCKQRKSC